MFEYGLLYLIISNHTRLLSIKEVAGDLQVSEALVQKFIKKGLIHPIYDDDIAPKLTSYGKRQLSRIVDLYEKSYSTESIEYIINT